MTPSKITLNTERTKKTEIYATRDEEREFYSHEYVL